MIRIRILIFTRTDLDPTIVLRVHSFYMKLCLASLFFFTYSERLAFTTVSLVFFHFAYICPSIKCAKSLSLLEINKIHTVPVIYRFPL